MHDPLNGCPPGGGTLLHTDPHTAILIDLSHETRQQSHLLGRIASQVEAGTRFHGEVRSHMVQTNSRLMRLETAPSPPRSKSSGLARALGLLRELEPVSKWLAGAALVGASLAGHTWPAEIKALLLSPFGGP